VVGLYFQKYSACLYNISYSAGLLCGNSEACLNYCNYSYDQGTEGEDSVQLTSSLSSLVV
jgi:hypothetical protein